MNIHPDKEEENDWRDWVAMHALTAIIRAEPYVDKDNPFFRAEVLKRTRMAYLYADAMIEARK